jgi:hypothetical protein
MKASARPAAVGTTAAEGAGAGRSASFAARTRCLIRIFRPDGARPPSEMMVAFIDDDHREPTESSRSGRCCRSLVDLLLHWVIACPCVDCIVVVRGNAGSFGHLLHGRAAIRADQEEADSQEMRVSMCNIVMRVPKLRSQTAAVCHRPRRSRSAAGLVQSSVSDQRFLCSAPDAAVLIHGRATITSSVPHPSAPIQ